MVAATAVERNSGGDGRSSGEGGSIRAKVGPTGMERRKVVHL